jgi:hypothetical protein
LIEVRNDLSAMSTSELDRVAELADRLAERALGALERGELTIKEFQNSPDVALLLHAAELVLSAGGEFPPSVRRLAAHGRIGVGAPTTRCSLVALSRR